MTKTAAHSTQTGRTRAARETTLSTLRGRLRVGTAMAGMILPLGIPGLALAADECGTPVSGVVTCSAAGNPYAGGITYATGGLDLTVILSADAVVQAAVGSAGIAVIDSAGKITINSDGRVTTEGDYNNAVTAKSTADAVSVTNTGIISTAGEGSEGIEASSQDGAVSVRNDGTITIAGANGAAIYADSTAGDVTVTNAGTLTTSGAGSEAISVSSTQGNVVVTNSGDISTTGDDAGAIQASSTNGNVTVTSTGTVTTVDGTAVSAGAGGTGRVRIDVSSVTAGGGGRAIEASSADGDINVKVETATSTSEEGPTVDMRSINGNLTLEAGTLTTFGGISLGVFAYTGTGIIDLKADSIVTQGEDSGGIDATTDSGAINIDVGTITTQGEAADGIEVATTSGAISIDVDSIVTQAEDSDGIDAVTDSGTIDIDVGTVTTAGDGADAVQAETTSGAITINARGELSTAGDFSNGVDVETDSGDVDITVNDIKTAGEDSDGVAASSGSGKLTVNAKGAITTKGKSGRGIAAFSDSGDITVTAGDIDTDRDNGHGIEAYSMSGDIDITDNGKIAVRGENAHGIKAQSAGSIDVTADSVSVSGYYADGIVLSSEAGIDLTLRDLRVTGGGSDGIRAYTTSGPVRIDVGNVHASSGRAISAETGAGDTTLRITGKVQGTNADNVVYAGSTGDTRIDILAGGEVSSFDGDRIAIEANGTNVVINNAGLVSATSVPTVLVDGPARLVNTGTLVGSVSFGGGDAHVVSSGMFKLSGTSKFRSGDDLFENSGTVSLLDSATLDGLERFENAGRVTMANSHAGEVLKISGDYVGKNGRLVLDIDAAATGGNDKLVIGGAASGSTVIALNSLRGTALLPGKRLTLVDAAGGSDAGAFTLAPETIDAGFARYFMNYESSDDIFEVYAQEGLGLFQTLNISEGAQSLWRQSADVWSARTMAQRDPAGEAHDRTPVWVQFYGSVEHRDQGFTASSGTFDISYRQRHAGGQIGVDLGEIGGVTYGVTGGHLASVLKFAGTGDRTEYDAFSLGAYAQGEWDGYFVNALAKYDVLGASIDSVTGGFTEKVDGKAYGLQVEAGARFGDSGLFIEPVATLAYSATDLDTLAALGATVDFARTNSLLGKAGARIGGTADIGGGLATFYLGAHVVNEFEGKGSVRFDTGSLTTKLVDDSIGTYGQFQLGATLASKAGLTGFVEATATVGRDYQNYGGRMGLRLAF